MRSPLNKTHFHLIDATIPCQNVSFPNGTQFDKPTLDRKRLHPAFYRHGGGASAISHMRRRTPSTGEIAGQARNDDLRGGLPSIKC